MIGLYTAAMNRLCDRYPEEGLQVGPSNIPNAGKGLFVTRSFNKGDFIGVYKGEVIDEEECRRRYTDGENDYLLNIHDKCLPVIPRKKSQQLVIDAIDPEKSNLTRYINDTRNKKQLNCRWAAYSVWAELGLEVQVMIVIATRDIEKGSELYLSYGHLYWT